MIYDMIRLFHQYQHDFYEGRPKYLHSTLKQKNDYKKVKTGLFKA